MLTRTTAFGYYDHNFLGLLERVTDHLAADAAPHLPRQRLWKVRARQVVLATGALERPLVFAENDRPGIMLASAARTYVNRYAVRPGRRAVVFTNNDSAYRTALDLLRAGVGVSVIDLRADPQGSLPAEARAAGISVLAGHAITGTKGRHRVASVQVRRLNASGDQVEGPVDTIPCDLVCVAGGWNPTIHLQSQSRAMPRYDDARALFLPGEPRQPERSAGACNGAFALRACLEQGARAGHEAAAAAGFTAELPELPQLDEPEEAPARTMWLVPSGRPLQRSKMFVDLQNDVTAGDIRLALGEGYRSIEHVKRYTTTGMGTDQGKTANVNALGIVAEITGESVAEIGVTTFRPPYTPVTFGAVVGRNCGAMFDPVRRTPMHAWHETHGAVFEDVGQWKRPWYYPGAGEDMAAAVAREVKATRAGIGILDASTLGKIDIQGPDAAELLNRIYTNAWGRLAVGRCRYGLMLGEDGMVFDDGVTTRLGEHHYLMSTTSGGAARVLAWLEEWLQTEWPELEVYCTSVTEQWATIAISGPDSRRLLAELAEGIDLAPAAFPHMSMRDGQGARRAGARVPDQLHGRARLRDPGAGELWPRGLGGVHRGRREVRDHAVRYRGDARPARREGIHHHRPGHRRYGDAARSRHGLDRGAAEAGFHRQALACSRRYPKARPQAAGRALARASRASCSRKARRSSPTRIKSIPMTMIGHVTSSYMSPNLGRSFALALVKDGRARIGERLYVPMLDRTIAVTVTEPVFFDKEGERLRA